MLKFINIAKLYIVCKKINTFWSGISVVYIISNLYVLNCFKYIF